MNPPPPFTGRRTPSTPRAPRESPSQWETRPASSPLLRPFPFTTPLHPLLYEKKERSGGRKGAAEGKGRSRRFGVALRGPPEPLGRSPTAPPVAPCRRTHPQWGGWGSWDGLEMGTCPDLLQRRSGPGSVARRNAEYQRFFSHASARPGSLQQIWTNRRRQAPSPGAAAGWTAAVTNAPAIPQAAAPARPAPPDAPGAQTCTSHSKVQFQPLFSSAKCTSRREFRLSDAPDREPGARSGSFRSQGASTPGSPWGRGGRAAAPRRSPRR